MLVSFSLLWVYFKISFPGNNFVSFLIKHIEFNLKASPATMLSGAGKGVCAILRAILFAAILSFAHYLIELLLKLQGFFCLLVQQLFQELNFVTLFNGQA